MMMKSSLVNALTRDPKDGRFLVLPRFVISHMVRLAEIVCFKDRKHKIIGLLIILCSFNQRKDTIDIYIIRPVCSEIITKE